MKKVLTCVGTRPNLIKITQLEKQFRALKDIEYKLLHTGQHFDFNMNDVFFQQMAMRKPDVFLNINQGSQIEVITNIMQAFEVYIKEHRPDIVIVPGDVNSTFACAFVANRYGIPVAHIESGLRSFDMTMPEEVNRILVDAIADLYFVTEESGKNNLLNEGKDERKIKFTGNSMIDSLVAFMPEIDANNIREKLNVNEYVLFTFHRPSNVDDETRLALLADLMLKIAVSSKVVFPVHPRTQKNLAAFGLMEKLTNGQIIFTDPLGYFEFMNLVKNSKCVITDSGGVQEETTYLQVPCLTVRQNTERPVTVDSGTNTMVELNIEKILSIVEQINNGAYKKGSIPPLWDGKSCERIANFILDFLNT